MTATLIAAWLLTYLIHSTIFLSAALAVSRINGENSLKAQEIILRTALVGGILTATLQLGLGIAPLAGVFAIESASQPQISVWVGAPSTTGSEFAVESSTQTAFTSGIGWATALVVFWGIGSIFALLAVLRSVIDLRRLLQTRCFQPAGRLVEVLATAMGLRRQVKLSTSKAIAVPFATGIRQPEICCPERVEELAREHRTSLFAHELAHLARRDPAWQLLYRLGEAIFVLQPLNRLVRRRLEEIAEHLTDERAVACTGDRLGLARCLVVVAHWGVSSRFGLPATAFAAGPRLDRRVQRLISGRTDRHVGTQWAFLLALALLISAVTILPTVGASPAHAEQSAPAATNTTTWSIYANESGSGTEVSEAKTWSLVDERPVEAPPAPPQPAPPKAASPAQVADSAAPEAAPRPAAVPRSSAAPRPATAPRPDSAPRSAAAPPAPASDVQPAAADQPPPPCTPVAPEPPDPEEPKADAHQAEELERRRYEWDTQRERALERAVAEERGRAEERARTREQAYEKRAQELALRAEEIAAGAAEISAAQREEFRQQAIEMRNEAREMAQEHSRAERERARALAEEGRELQSEAARVAAQLTDEQREALRRRALELQAQFKEQQVEAEREARERARALFEEARRLAEEAEAERQKLEDLEKKEKQQ